MSDLLYRYRKTFGPEFVACTAWVYPILYSPHGSAEFGFMILGFVILANVLKYPFFEHGSRYANVTGTSITMDMKTGEKIPNSISRNHFGLYVFVTAAVGFVTAGFLKIFFRLIFLEYGHGSVVCNMWSHFVLENLELWMELSK